MSNKRKSTDGQFSASKRLRFDNDSSDGQASRSNYSQQRTQYPQNSNGKSSFDQQKNFRNGTPNNKSSIQPMPTTHKPPLPSISFEYKKSVFTHPSLCGHEFHRAESSYSEAKFGSYDRLEFLGDAYIEVIASRLIWSRYQHLSVGRMSHLRELLVKNETLSKFSLMYGFDQKLKATPRILEHNSSVTEQKWTKIMGDIFEAYVAGVIVSDPVDGYREAEEWLMELWRPMLESLHETSSSSSSIDKNPPPTLPSIASSIFDDPSTSTHQKRSSISSTSTNPILNTTSTTQPSSKPPTSSKFNPLSAPNLKCKENLATHILCAATKLEYLETSPAEIHLNRGLETFHMAVYFSGYDGKYTRLKLGSGSGPSKVSAGQIAAERALEDEMGILDALREEKKAWVEKRRKEKEER